MIENHKEFVKKPRFIVLCRAGYKNESREHDGYFSKIADLPHKKANLN